MSTTGLMSAASFAVLVISEMAQPEDDRRSISASRKRWRASMSFSFSKVMASMSGGLGKGKWDGDRRVERSRWIAKRHRGGGGSALRALRRRGGCHFLR